MQSNIENGIFKDYFQYTKEYKSKYGQKTIVLMQVGAFFEIYGVKDPISCDIHESDIQELSEICELNISEKKIKYGKGTIVMAGFRDFTIDKYLLKLTDYGYTVPVFIQEKDGRDITRKLDRVYSAGTYMSYETDLSPKITNNIMCIWLESFKPISKSTAVHRNTIAYGVSVVNIFTGKSSIFQYETTFYMNTTTFDELERYVTVFCPNEVIIISPFDEKELYSIIQFSGIQSTNIHKINNQEQPTQVVKNCSNQKYIRHILSSFFGEEAYDICTEFHNRIMATQSFCYLLHFIQEHNPDLVRKITIPEFNNTSDRMVLANHTLIQLNIIEGYTGGVQKHNKLSSVFSLLNKCCTPMGRRKFQGQITSPTFNEKWLNTEYNITNILLLTENAHFVDLFRKQLTSVRDIEKICRQLILKKIYPSSIFHLYKSIFSIQQMNTCLYESVDICNYLCSDFMSTCKDCSSNAYVQNTTAKILNFLDTHLHIDICKTISSMNTFDENIIRSGVSEKLDETVRQYNLNKENFQTIRVFLNTLMQTHEKSPDTDYVKVHETEKSGVCLQITAKRSLILNKALIEKTDKNTGMIDIINGLSIKTSDIKFTKSSAANVDIECPLIVDICKKLLLFKDTINTLIAQTYLDILTKLEIELFAELEQIATFVSKLDVMQCKAYIAKQYNYCCPEIVSDSPKSFVDAHNLRHCLIEHLQQNEIYVANDISLGSTALDGILLYGTNAVGKTSLIRALGISVIMAQAGMFVPCTQFLYKPYTAIFSRILGNDNIFKGLSTFAVEMSELRIILKMADENSLILGDELCSGTEMESALSIFVAGLMNLHAKKSSFIFATHFHEIVDYSEIKGLSNLTMKHMAVMYDRELDCLVYSRKLIDGSGPRIYGLEVCKSLYLTDEFLESAYAIRNKYYPETRGELSHKPTVYNSQKIRGMCEKCGKNIAEETHHLKQQKDANDDGFIDTFHKNHPANLLAVCETCHNQIHYSESQSSTLLRKKTTKGYVLHN